METNFNIADSSELTKQHAYADKLVKEGFDFGLTVGSAFVDSMRSTYYKHTGTALDEIIDNSLEAGASNIHLAFGFPSKSTNKPDAFAIIDDGHGMPENMVRLAVLWGGTHRQGSRSGFGRFGFGLPSASVNQGERYSIYSLTSGNSWSSVTVDLEDIRKGVHTDKTGRVVAPKPSIKEPPEWVKSYIKTNFKDGKLKSGTVVLIEKLDRHTWKTVSGLTKNLSEHFGVTYRNYLSDTNLFIDGEKVEPLDPHFITPGLRYHTIEGDPDQAMSLEPGFFEVAPKNGGEKVLVRLRFARFPLTYFRVDKNKDAGRGNQNPRFSVKTDTLGLIVNRMGRQIDVVEKTPWTGFEKFRNDDRYWAVEIDFPAELDEEFQVSNSKQGVFLSERMWDLLKLAGVENALKALRSANKAEDRKKNEPKIGGTKSSELSMEEAQKFKRKKPEHNTEDRIKKAKDNLERYVKKKAEETQQTEAEIRAAVVNDSVKHPYRVEFENMPGSPFYRLEQIGVMRVLFINRSHRFYQDIYSHAKTRHAQAALEVLLFVLGECELDAQSNDDRSLFYSSERSEWSQLLENALGVLSRYQEETEIVDSGDEMENVA